MQASFTLIEVARFRRTGPSSTTLLPWAAPVKRSGAGISRSGVASSGGSDALRTAQNATQKLAKLQS